MEYEVTYEDEEDVEEEEKQDDNEQTSNDEDPKDVEIATDALVDSSSVDQNTLLFHMWKNLFSGTGWVRSWSEAGR